MSHDFNYRVDGQALVAAGYAKGVRMQEGSAGVRAEMLSIAYRHGIYVATRHWQEPRALNLEITYPAATPTLTYTARENIDALLYGGVKTLTRDEPLQGDLQCEIITVDEIVQGENRNRRFIWPYTVWQTRGFWEEASEQTEVDTGMGASSTIGPFAVGGTVRIEPKFTITCTADGDTPAIEHVATGAKLTVVGSYVNTDVIVVDVANDLVTLNGTPAKNILRITRGYLMELDPNPAISLAFTSDSGTWSVTTGWRDRFR